MEKYIKRLRKDKNAGGMGDDKSTDSSGSCETDHGMKSSTPQNKRKTKFSKVWKYFTKSGDKQLAKCLTCGKEYKTSGNTSNLMDHLKRCHPHEDKGTANEENDTPNIESITESTSSSRQSSTRSVASYFARAVEYAKDSKRRKDIDRALALLVATDYQPINIVENKGFIYFVKVLDPRYILPSARTLKDVLLKNLFDEIKMKLKNALSEVSYVAVTCDGWTSVANEGYLTVTCHFVDSNFHLQSAVLSTEKLNDPTNHNGQNTASSLKKVLNEWSIFKKVTCIVTDNAKVMINACNILEKRNMPCAAHTLNLVVQDALTNSAAISDLRKKCKTIVTFFKNSTISNEKFKKEQQSDNPLSLLQEMPTRWNSVYLMFCRIACTNAAISKVLLSTVKAPSPLTACDLLVIEDINSMLSLFADATEKLSGSCYVTLSLVIPMACGMNRKLAQLKPKLKTSDGSDFCELLLLGMKKRMEQYENRTVSKVATILDPRFKKEGFQTNANMQAAAKLVEDEVHQLCKSYNAEKSFHLEQPTTSAQSSSLLDFIDERLENKKKSSRVDAILSLRQYYEADNASRDVDPLLYWKIASENLNPLKECAMKYMCIPATSVESERIFSKAGLIINERRARLKPKQVNILIFLNKNKWLINN